MRITILNGPNLNLIGKREPEIYGNVSLDGYLDELRSEFAALADVQCYQSNHEGSLIDAIQAEIGHSDALVVNFGAYSHTSIALHDALKSFQGLKIEVHISNIHARETYRHHSYTASACKAIISGLGLYGYRAAVAYCIQHLND